MSASPEAFVALFFFGDPASADDSSFVIWSAVLMILSPSGPIASCSDPGAAIAGFVTTGLTTAGLLVWRERRRRRVWASPSTTQTPTKTIRLRKNAIVRRNR